MKLKMKKAAFFFLLLMSIVGIAQKKMGSPSETVTGKSNGANITIKYGSPSVKGRVIWGGLVPFNQIWRAGANEATTFATDKTITIAGKQLPAGVYSFFVLPHENQSIIIFNKIAKQWGTNDYMESNDQLRVTVENIIADESVEKLEYRIMETRIELSWDNLIIGFDVK